MKGRKSQMGKGQTRLLTLDAGNGDAIVRQHIGNVSKLVSRCGEDDGVKSS